MRVRPSGVISLRIVMYVYLLAPGQADGCHVTLGPHVQTTTSPEMPLTLRNLLQATSSPAG